MLRLYRYMNSFAWHYLCFLSFLSLAITVLTRTSLVFFDTSHFDNTHDHDIVLINKEFNMGSRGPYKTLLRSFGSSSHGQLQAVMQEESEYQHNSVIEEFSHNDNQSLLQEEMITSKGTKSGAKPTIDQIRSLTTLSSAQYTSESPLPYATQSYKDIDDAAEITPSIEFDDDDDDDDAQETIFKLSSCDGRRIYMYNLPTEFNTLILQQCNNKIAPWLNFCPHFLNNGLGKPADDSENWPDWYETDPYMLEVIFHRRMSSYECRTKEAAQADAFFIPYYSGLDALHYLYGQKKTERALQGVKLVRWLMQKKGGKYWARRGGHDHFIVMGRTAWDFTYNALPSSQNSVQRTTGEAWDRSIAAELSSAEDGGWGTSFANLPEMENVTAMFLEKRPWRRIEQAIPYPTGFHPSSLGSLRAWQDKVRAANRTFLFAFVGAPRRTPVGNASSLLEFSSVRQAALQQCAMNTTACTLLDCSQIKCAHDPVRIAERLMGAHFCLQPPGDTVTRRSTFDGLLSGCIPVFFNEDSAYTQYSWHLPTKMNPSSYSVYVPADQLRRLEPLLAAISAERIAHMRSFIIDNLIPRVIYASPQLAASHPSLRDAFQLSVDGMLHRVAEKKKSWAFEQQAPLY